jgi:hypothetical protein
MPAIVRSPEEEADWNRAKEIVRKEYPGVETEEKEKFYALVTTVYKSIRKGHGDERWEGKEGWEALIQESQRSQAVQEWIVPVKALRHGDQVGVLTVLGRTLVEGIVQGIGFSELQVQIQRGLQQTSSMYEHKLSVYVLKAMTEESEKALRLREDLVGDPPDILTIPKPGQAPEIELIQKELGWIESARQAALLWGEIRRVGFESAMKAHLIPDDQIQSLKQAFIKGKYLDLK